MTRSAVLLGLAALAQGQLQPTTGSSDTGYYTGGKEDFRGTEGDATSYGTNDRDGASDSNLKSPDAITGIPYTNASDNGANATGAFANANGVYGNFDLDALEFTSLGAGRCLNTTGEEPTQAYGFGTTAAECEANCAQDPTCNGYRWDPMNAPTECVHYQSEVNLAQSWDGTGTKPVECMKKIGGAMAKVGDDTGPGCSAQGFVCDFAEIGKMGDYEPKDFIWKVVDPTQRYSRTGYTQQTLNCQVKITYADEATGSAAIYGGGKDWFFVPMGQANVGSTDYCDIEAIRRDFKDSELYMNDTIHIRGETARLNNQQDSQYDLVGEFFDLICGCMTELSTEASLKDGLKQHSSALLTVMTSTGTRRELGVELLLYSDDKLDNKVEFPQTFPDNSQRFYFLARHLADNDWDAKLQINKCIACSISDDCSTDADSGKRVIFYEQCSTILGGPQERLVHPNSWYNDKTVSSTYKRTVGGVAQWADADPDTCPYAALGLQKFRLAQRETMQVTCAVTACEKLPCAPCSARRQLLAGRALQAANAVDVTMFMSLGQGSTEDAKELETEEQKSEQKKKRGTMFIVMIVLVAILALGAILTVRHITKKNKAANEARSVKPLEA